MNDNTLWTLEGVVKLSMFMFDDLGDKKRHKLKDNGVTLSKVLDCYTKILTDLIKTNLNNGPFGVLQSEEAHDSLEYITNIFRSMIFRK